MERHPLTLEAARARNLMEALAKRIDQIVSPSSTLRATLRVYRLKPNNTVAMLLQKFELGPVEEKRKARKNSLIGKLIVAVEALGLSISEKPDDELMAALNKATAAPEKARRWSNDGPGLHDINIDDLEQNPSLVDQFLSPIEALGLNDKFAKIVHGRVRKIFEIYNWESIEVEVEDIDTFDTFLRNPKWDLPPLAWGITEEAEHYLKQRAAEMEPPKVRRWIAVPGSVGDMLLNDLTDDEMLLLQLLSPIEALGLPAELTGSLRQLEANTVWQVYMKASGRRGGEMSKVINEALTHPEWSLPTLDWNVSKMLERKLEEEMSKPPPAKEKHEPIDVATELKKKMAQLNGEWYQLNSEWDETTVLLTAYRATLGNHRAAGTELGNKLGLAQGEPAPISDLEQSAESRLSKLNDQMAEKQADMAVVRRAYFLLVGEEMTEL